MGINYRYANLTYIEGLNLKIIFLYAKQKYHFCSGG